MVAIETRAMSGRMTQFMQRRAVPVDRFEIGLRRRDLYIIFGCCIECAFSTNPKWDSAGLDQGFDCGFDQARRRWRRSGGDLVGKFFTLIGVENGKSLEEWNCLCFFAGLGGASSFVSGHEPVGVNDGGTAFTFADVTSKRERLAESEPTLAGKSAFDRSSPEDEDVNATPLYCRLVDAFFGMARSALAAAVPQGWTQGTRPASSSAIILSVISS